MKNLLTFIVCMCVSVSGFSQITEAEYFFDSDPGIGSATSVAVTAGNTIDENYSNISTTGLTEGLHTLHVRAKGTNNIWSLYKRAYFYVKAPNSNASATPIIAAEYYIDTAPGVGSATSDAVTQGFTIEEVFTIATTGLAEGLHVLHIRVKDDDDTWSLFKRAYFYTHTTNSNTSATPIMAAEYFFDTDPGVGNASSIGVTQGFNLDENLVIQVPEALTEGEHYLYVRAQDQEGTWSLYKRALFTADSTVSVEEFSSDSFDIFPNPTKNNIHINFNQSGDYSVSVFNISGKEIVHQETLERNNRFDLSKYAAGIYILKIKDKTRRTFQNIKIVKL